MFFAATQSAAFAVDDAVEAIKIGLTVIPRNCLLAKDVRWALKRGKDIKNFRDARRSVDARFAGMRGTHTNNNVCLTIFGLLIGSPDVTKVLSQTVAMGLVSELRSKTVVRVMDDSVGKRDLKPYAR